MSQKWNISYMIHNSKIGKAVPEGSTKLRFPDYVTMAQDGGKVVNLTHRPFLPSVRG